MKAPHEARPSTSLINQKTLFVHEFFAERNQWFILLIIDIDLCFSSSEETPYNAATLSR